MRRFNVLINSQSKFNNRFEHASCKLENVRELPREHLEQKFWYLDHQKEFEKLKGKWIGLSKNTLVFATDYDLLTNELEKFRGTEIRPLLILVGAEKLNSVGENIFLPAEIFSIKQSEIEQLQDNLRVVSKNDALSPSMPSLRNSISTPNASFEHSREYQEDSLFRTECRYQAPFSDSFFPRPVLSTLVGGKIVSFLISPCSPFTYLSKNSLQNLGLVNNNPHFDFWGDLTYIGSLFGKKTLFRVSRREYFENVNILGNDVIRQHKLVFSKNNNPTWDPHE